MLKVYGKALELVRDVKVMVDEIAVADRDLANQIKRASVSVVLNLSEGSATRDGRRRVRYGTALGSLRETQAGLDVAGALGYIGEIEPAIRDRMEHIKAVLIVILR